MVQENKFDIQRFDGTEFSLWKFQMTVFLRGQELIGVVDGTSVKPVDEDGNQTLAKWVKADNKAMMFITQALGKSQLSYVVNCESSKAMWDRLITIHEQKNKMSLHSVQTKFFKYRMDPNDTIATHIGKVEGLARQLQDLGAKPDNSAIITQILCTLPPGYRGFVSSWYATATEAQTLENLTSRLLQEEEAEKMMSNHAQDRGEALVASGSKYQRSRKSPHQKQKFAGKCNHCDMKGHKENDCWELHPEKRPHNRNRRSGQAAAANISEAEGASALMAVTSPGLLSPSSTTWICDSGATDHMCGQLHLFSNFAAVPQGSFSITMANKKVIFCQGIGDVDLVAWNGQQFENITLKRVLYLPELGRNLFSIHAAAEKGATFKFNAKSCEVFREGRVLAKGTKVGKLYLMSFREPASAAAAAAENKAEANLSERDFQNHIRLWHERLGHANVRTVRKAISNQDANVSFSGNETESFVCRGCSLGKQHRESFPKGPKKRKEIPGELIHTDLVGKMTPASVGGSNYFLLFKDDASNYMHIYFLKAKTEVLDCMKQFVIDWRHDSKGLPISELQTDRGTEFLNAETKDWLLSNEIRHQTSFPYCAPMNGFIERANRTVVETARAMIYGARVDAEL